jgi:uncharacterized protein (DUF1800 family)
MKLSRREFVIGSTAVLAGCDAAYHSASRYLAGGIPKEFAKPDSATLDPDFHFLSRTSFGPMPGDLDRLRKMGRDAYLEEQLYPDRIDDTACTILWRRFESLHLKAGDSFEFERDVAEDELTRATLLRQIYSKRQLYEVMVEFWSDHLNIFHGKGKCAWLKTADDRDVVRPHALGRFRDLIRASALSPAMLYYLDGHDNHKEKPNENYARELLELHTMGIHEHNPPYSQPDVMEVARCLTGWDVREGWVKGKVEFHKDRYDDGAKTVLRRVIPAGGGEKDLDLVLDIVTRHPMTAKYIASKLYRRFVSDESNPAAVEAIAKRFLDTDGDIRETVRTVLSHLSPPSLRFKRPNRFMISALRGLAVTTQAKRSLQQYLQRMGQAPYQYPTPDGYPDEMTPWLGTMLWRWNFALNLAHGKVDSDVKIGLEKPDPVALFPHLVGRKPGEAELQSIQSQASPEEGLALVLASPAFQWY